MDMKSAPETVSKRLKGQFAPAYLTLTSIIQVFVAFLALVGIIVFVGSSAPFWNQLLAYARGEQRTGRQRKGQAESSER